MKQIFVFLIILPFYGFAQNSDTVKISVKEYQDKIYASGGLHSLLKN